MTQVALSRVGDMTQSQQADLKKDWPPAAAKAQLTAIVGEQQDSSQSLLLLSPYFN